MSTFNSNFAPPASNANQMNLANGTQGSGGMPPTGQQYQQYQQQQQQQQILQQKYQQQQIQHQQQPSLPIQHQQQQQQQHSQPQQQTGNVLPPPPQFNNTFVNKQMPMSSNTVPTSAANGPLPPPLGGVQSPVSNLPPHLRPPTQNGPAIINGGSEVTSANSSRTASPGLYNMPPQVVGGTQTTTQTPYTLTQQFSSNPMQYVGRPASGVMPQSTALQSDSGMPLNRTNGPPVATTTNLAQQNFSGVNNLSNTMQNMNLSGQVGNENRLTAGGRPGERNLQRGVAPIQTISSEASGATRQSDISNPTQPNESRGTPIFPQDALFQPTIPVNRNPASIFGSAVGPPISQRVMAKLPYGIQPPTTNVMPETQTNNNKQALQPPPPMSSPTAPTGAAPNTGPTSLPGPSTGSAPPIAKLPSMPTSTSNAALTTQRKAMYPSSNSQLPPVAGIQQPYQQSPYAQAYQHQQPQSQQNFQQPQAQQPTGFFNGQTPSGPLQYQSQPPTNSSTPQVQQQQQSLNAASPYNSAMSVTNQGFSRLWGQDTIDLMQNRHILSPATLPPPKIVLHNQFHESINCSPSIMRCTLAKIPENNSLLQKSRLPLGILIHPFRDINSLPVIQCPNIVRCRLCRTYINPFVYFVDSKMWKCNLCYRVNELPEDFQFDPATKTYGDVTRRPEVRSSTIEFIAPSEYMLRPPQPAIYLFLFDVSIISQQSGYLDTACSVLSKHLDDMPGDARTQVGFIAYDSYVHFYSMAEGFNQPHEMTLLDIDDPFLPRPDSLLVNLKECKELIKDLLHQLPKRFAHTHDPGSALGAALQVAYKLMQASGGRITVFQTCLPNRGPGALEPREDPNNRSAKDVAHLNPATDFYKRYALECSGYQIAVDLFLMNQQYSDMATISGISKHSGGCVHHFPLYQNTKQQHVDSFKHCFKRYLTRKIGFEAVMRIRCTRGLQVHTFHGNFFVRSTDLLSLPNVNPDAGYGMQISYEESLTDVKTICFQAALLYTNSEGERRIRVHTLCLPVTASLPEVMHSADTEAIIGLLSKMAVDRSITSNVSDAREAFINATVDVFNAFKIAQNLPSGQSGQLIAPRSLALMPLYILSLLKHPAFRVGTSTRLDDRVYAMDCMKTLPLDQLMKFVYPEFFKLDILFYNVQNSNQDTNDDDVLPDVPRLQLSAEFLDSRSIFLMDCGLQILIYVGMNVPVEILEKTLGIKTTASLPDYYYGLPNVNSSENEILRRFIAHLNEEKPYAPLIQVIRDTSTAKPQFIEKLVDDRSESSLSYYEFLQHIRTQVK